MGHSTFLYKSLRNKEDLTDENGGPNTKCFMQHPPFS